MKKITQSTQTESIKNVKRKWHLIDISDKRLGRVTNSIAIYLQGKHKVTYSPNIDMGDYVVVINAKKVTLSGKKAESKEYSYYSGYPGGLRKVDFKSMLQKKPNEIIRHAVSGMLPKNKLRDRRLARLFIYGDDNHPYKEKLEKQ